MVTWTVPSGCEQFTLRTCKVTGAPDVAATTSLTGCRRFSTVFPEHVIDPFTFKRFPVTVSARDPREAPPARIRLLRAPQSRLGLWAANNAAAPDTCGAAIEVPESIP